MPACHSYEQSQPNVQTLVREISGSLHLSYEMVRMQLSVGLAKTAEANGIPIAADNRSPGQRC